MEQRKRRKTRRSRKKNNAFIIAGAVAFALVLAFFVCGIAAADAQNVFPNVYYNGVDLGEMSYIEAVGALKNANLTFADGRTVSVELTDDYTLKVTGADAGFAGSAEDAAHVALNYGKNGSFFSNTFKYLGSVFAKHDLGEIKTFDAETVGALIADAAKAVNHGAVSGSYAVENDVLSVVKGAAEYKVNEKAVYDFIYNVFTTEGSDDVFTDEFSEAKNSAAGGDAIDFDSVRSQVYVEAKNASFDITTGEAVSGVVGVDLDVSAAKALYAAAAPGERIDIPLIITQPEIDVGDVESELFKDCFASKTTSLSTSSSNRINNVSLAAAAMNGKILMPGEVFSYNECLGKRTEAKGYKSAGAYSGGLEVQQIGGGICQGSSTLYYCVLKSNLKVVERSNHMFSVAYLPLGMDATVDWGNVDFKFKNDKEYPIKLVAFVEDKQLTVEIWGTKTDEYTYDLKSVRTGVFDYETVEELDPTKQPGEKEVSVTGHKGYTSEAYLLTYDKDGKLISEKLISKDKYRTRNKVILVGELTPVDPTPVDPTPVDPTPVDPTPVDPTPVDPTPVDPTPGDTPTGDTDPVTPDIGV